MTEWFCGFETGNRGDDWYPTPTSYYSISTSSPNYGNFCGTFTYTGTQTGQAQQGIATSSLPYASPLTWNTIPISFSCAIRINTLPNAGCSEEIVTMQGMQLHIDDTGKLSLWAGFPPPPTRRATGSTALIVGHWYTLEICLYDSTHMKVRVYPVGHAPTADEFIYSATMGSTGFNIGKSSDYDGSGYSASFDDIWIKDGVAGGYLGPCNVYLVSGNNDPPIYDAFNKTGAGPNAADCWNETPSNPATACTSNAAGDVKQSMAHHPLWPIGATATINAVKTTVIGANTQSDSLSVMTLIGPPGSIVETDYPIALQFSAYWSVAWASPPTLTLLNSAQTGVWRHAGSANITSIYECHTQVCYSNLVIPPPAGTGLTQEFVIM